MFVRVRDFGQANRDLIPESSTGGQLFGRVAAAVTAIEEHQTKRDLARGETRRVKATTYAAVFDYMKILAHTARRATLDESVRNPFVLPRRRTMSAMLSKARLFIDEAKSREGKFVNLGLASTFVSEFSMLVEQLHDAVETRNTARAHREKAQAGIERALADGFEAIRNLDVLVPNTLRADAVRLGHWRGARHLDGMASSSARGKAEHAALLVKAS
jgi:hypothetical protein